MNRIRTWIVFRNVIGDIIGNMGMASGPWERPWERTRRNAW